MSTWVVATAHLPPRDIIAACAKRGVTVADYQLRRWAQYGLIPKAVRKGRGKKHGSLWSYPLDTSERPLLIARTLQEGDKSLSRAAVVLLGAGLVIRPDQLRHVLRHGEISPVGADCKRRRQPKHGARGGVDRIEALLTERRRYLTDDLTPDVSKAKRLKESLRRAYKGQPADVVDAMSDLVMASFDLQDKQSVYASMGLYVGPKGIRHALDAISDDNLLAAYHRALNTLPLLALQTTLFVGGVLPPLLHHARSRAQLAGLSLDLPYRLGAAIYPPAPVSHSAAEIAQWEQLAPQRLLATLWHVLVSVYGESFTQAARTSVHDLVDTTFDLNTTVPHDLKAIIHDGGSEPA